MVTGGIGRASIRHMVLEVERAKTWVGVAVSPASSQRLFKEALESLSFSQTPNNCIVDIKDDPILYFISAGHPLLLFSIIFLALCKSSWWAKDLTSIEMLPPFCTYFMDVGWTFEKKQSFSLQVLIFSKSLLAHDD